MEDCHIYWKEHVEFLASQDRKSHVPAVECRKGHWKGMRHLQPLYHQLCLFTNSILKQTEARQSVPGQDINSHTLCESSQLSPWTGWGRKESSLFEDMQNCRTGRNHLAKDVCCDWTSPRLGQVSVVSCRQL